MATLIRRFFRKNLYIIDIPNPDKTTSVKNAQLLASDIHRLFGVKEFIGVAWRGGKSDHEKGMALDIIPNCFPFIPRYKQHNTMDAIYSYLLEYADTYKINYIIWQNTCIQRPLWRSTKNITDTNGKTRSDLHLDHIRVSFMKIGDES